MSATILDVFDKVTLTQEFAVILEKADILEFNVDMDKKSVFVCLKSDQLISKYDLYVFIDSVKIKYDLNDFDIRIKYDNPLLFSDLYYKDVLYSLIRKHGVCRAFMGDSIADLEGNTLKISKIQSGREVLEKNQCARFIKELVSFELGIDAEVEFIYEESSIDEYLKRQDEAEAEIVKNVMNVAPVKREEKKNGSSKGSDKIGLVYGALIKERTVPIFSINENTGICVVEGNIFDCEIRELKRNNRVTGNTAVSFNIEDGEWAVSCSLFGKNEKLKNAISVINDGNRLKVRGNYELDKYTNKFVLNILSIEHLEKPPMRMDNAEEKRVELHLHTKMSAKDAITSAKDLIKRAGKWGHRAIAITDHGVAQAFPEAYSAAKAIKKDGRGFKVLYGVEGYYINDAGDSRVLKKGDIKGNYIVFDIETTGLSAVDEKITEIGAVKIESGVIVDTFAQLINPEREIPYNITKLTGITQEMVEDKPKIDEVLPEFLRFCGNYTIVAHNAAFDTGFIKVNVKELGLKFENRILDTLEISRELFPNEKSHKLNVVVERLGLTLENHHRAVDDATATGEVFLKFLQMVEENEAGNQTVAENKDLIKKKNSHIIILAKNYVGLKNLYKLISKSNLEYFYKRPIIPKSVLMEHREGLIIGSACEQGELYKAILNKRTQDEIEKIAKFYDYLEIQPLGNNEFMVRSGAAEGISELEDINKQIVVLGEKLKIPVVATCDVHFMDPEDEVYRRVLQGAQGYTDADLQAPLYFRTTEEMLEEFSYLGEEKAYEVVVKNTNLIADMIEDIQPVRDGSYPPTIENSEQDLVDMCKKKAHKVYGEKLPKIVEERMNRELDCILKYGYSVMYMIAHKLVKKSNEAGYLVGSRGSVGSSFAAFLAGITEVNALCPHYVCPNCKNSEFFSHGEYNIGIDMSDKECPNCGTKMNKDGFNIPFETFLGFKGDKVPDIDLNFSGEYQATAHKYVEELFGEGFVFKAGTIGTIADKTAFGYAKKYYELKNMPAPAAEIKRVSRGLVDIKQTTGQHPGGIIVCPKDMDIHDFCPIQHPADKKDSGIITTHFDFHSIHDNLLKLDILGHDDPSTIRMLEDLTGIDATKIPLDDPETMSIFSGTEVLRVTPEQINSKVGTFGVPEFGTSFVRQMLVDTMPKTFFELLIISGLSHGTDVWLNNAQDLVKAGTATLSEVIGLRDDIMVYLILKGLEPGMAFTIMEFVRKGRAATPAGLPEEYESAMRENNVPEWYINSCEKIKYMFPKAHAAAYVMMAFRVAYFKVHYPIDFYIAYFTVRADLFDVSTMAQGDQKLKEEMRKLELRSNELSATEKSVYTIMELCHELYQRNIEFLPVDIYKSHAYKFQKVDGKILPPLNAFQGLGTAAAENIMEAREEGPFLSQEDLKQRARINKSAVEALKENGCLDGMQETSQISLFDM